MSDLLRRHYDHPAIFLAMAQVLLDWDARGMEAFCHAITPEAGTSFLSITHNTHHTINFNLTGSSPTQSVVQEFGGATMQVDGQGSAIIVEPSGFRITLQGAYPGRERLFELCEWVVARLRESQPERRSSRVSVVFQTNVDPGGGSYRIEDYIVPRFELADPRLDVLQGFQHEVMIDLSPLKPGPYRCRLVVGTSAERRGFDILIDVLDDADTLIERVKDRMETVKTLESHVFESLVTQRTRVLYCCTDPE